MFDPVWHFLTILDLFEDIFLCDHFNQFCAIFDQVKIKIENC